MGPVGKFAKGGHSHRMPPTQTVAPRKERGDAWRVPFFRAPLVTEDYPVNTKAEWLEVHIAERCGGRMRGRGTRGRCSEAGAGRCIRGSLAFRAEFVQRSRLA